MPPPYAIVVFDGECAFCDRSVRWIIAHDRLGKFRFAPRQSPVGGQLLAANHLPPQGVESMILLEGSRVSTHSTGVLRIASMLPFPWRAAALFLLVPRPIRDFFYRALARRRYRLAGKPQACAVPTKEQREQILQESPM
jgi:predicted DCC family thiol-disulfide oxidoreductase YuxK